jgi:hypothetical protein
MAGTPGRSARCLLCFTCAAALFRETRLGRGKELTRGINCSNRASRSLWGVVGLLLSLFHGQVLQARTSVFSSLVTIYKAMGGGWVAEAAASSMSPIPAPRRMLDASGEEEP